MTGQPGCRRPTGQTGAWVNCLSPGIKRALSTSAEWNNESSRYQWPTVSLAVGKKTVTLDPLDSDWVKNGHTVLDALLKFQQADGSFWWREDTAGAVKGATAQSLAALVDLAYGESTKHRAGQAPDYDPKRNTFRGDRKAVKWYQTNYPAPENWEGLPAARQGRSERCLAV